MHTKDFLDFFKDTYFMMFHDSKKDMPVVDMKNTFDPFQISRKNEEGYGAFFSINQFPGGVRKIDQCAGVNAWAIDIDDKDIPIHIQKLRIERSPVHPTFVVRSRNGYHLYWAADNGTIENYSKIVQRLIQFFDADVKAKDITRVLRLPGTMHMKSDPYPVTVERFVDEMYTEETMLRQFPEPVTAEPNKFWAEVSALPNREMLERLSGRPEVNGEVYTFKENSNGSHQICCNDQSTSSWIDPDGHIGSHDRGGPTFVQWLQWYGHNKGKIASIIKSLGVIKELAQPPRLEPTPPLGIPVEASPATPKQQGDIVEMENAYHLRKWDKDGDPIYEKLTNFVLQPINIYIEYGSHEHIREYKLVNDAGQVAGPFKMHASIFGSFAEFKKFCIGKGRFVYFATEKSFPKIQNFVLYTSEHFKKINLIPRVGYVPKYDLWIFNNFAIKEGVLYKENDSKIIWINDEGFQSFNVSNTASDYSHTALNIDKPLPTDEEIRVLFTTYIRNLCISYGNDKVKIAISWMIANVFSFEVFSKYRIFPFLFIHGKTRSGKDVLSTWLISLFGLDHSIKESLPQMTSTVGINRKSAYYSSMPVVLDEYKNNHRIANRFDGFFKNLATRTGVTKGSKVAGEMKTEPIYSNFIFTSEELPLEPAIVNRSVVVRINPSERNDTLYDEINNHIDDFFQIGIYLIIKSSKFKKDFFEKISYLKDLLIENGVSTYNAEAYAIAGAGYMCVQDDPFYLEMLISEAKDSNVKKESTDKLAQFWSDLETIQASNMFNGIEPVRIDGDKVSIWMKFLSDKWNEFRIRHGLEPYGYHDLLEMIKESPAFVEANKVVIISEHSRRCVILKKSLVSNECMNFLDGSEKIGTMEVAQNAF